MTDRSRHMSPTLLKFPWRREELINWLRDFLNIEKLREDWTTDNPVSPVYAFYTFLEDKMLSFEHPYEQIGYSLFNDAEVKAVQQVALWLDRVVEEQGNVLYKPVSDYINSPAWYEVIQAAQHAYKELLSNE